MPVKKEKGVELVHENMEVPDDLVKKSELNDIVKRAENSATTLTDDDVRDVKMEVDGNDQSSIVNEPGQKQDHPGRPIDTMSKREKQLLERELKAQMGVLHRGRPRDPKSNRQQLLEERKAKAEKGLLRPGRPPYSEEEKKKAEIEKKQRHEERMKAIREKAAQILKEQGIKPLLPEVHAE